MTFWLELCAVYFPAGGVLAGGTFYAASTTANVLSLTAAARQLLTARTYKTAAVRRTYGYTSVGVV